MGNRAFFTKQEVVHYPGMNSLTNSPANNLVHPKVLVIGSGPIVIGQACEFDYSGTLALKALRQAGFSPILLNSNPATIMTDPGLADRTYIEPLTVETLLTIIRKEQPQYLLPTLGGQTALNLAMALAKHSEFPRLGVTLWAADPATIERAEDRLLFKNLLQQLGLPAAQSMLVSHPSQIDEAVRLIGAPAIIRPSFTLGGEGSGFATNNDQLRQMTARGLELSPVSSVLVEQSLLGWKEFELEAVLDAYGNFVIVCGIENLDPMGVHTGDSITIAPPMTLSDHHWQWMRDASKKIMAAVGVRTGGSNVQFAMNPQTYEMVVIEMNPRVSRSSALASKATGFPIAKTATLLATGKRLSDIPNDITGTTPASFEPMLDYVVTKIPRFDTDKFTMGVTDAAAVELLGSSMKSVGEVMAIGRTLAESLGKAIASLEQSQTELLNGREPQGSWSDPHIRQRLTERLINPHPRRIFTVLAAFCGGASVAEVNKLSAIDPWFCAQLKRIVDHYVGKPNQLDHLWVRQAKKLGIADKEIAGWYQKSEAEIIAFRTEHNILPTYYSVDTCAGEFPAKTPYFYSTYELASGARGSENSPKSSVEKKKVLVIGSGPNRIGQGIEFDYACVHCSLALRDLGYESIMVNCNPETVSTDYDVSSRLYFEPLTLEHIYEIYRHEKPDGVFLQFGGQTPLKLAHQLYQLGIPILGTSFDSIDIAEDRARFFEVIQELGLRQPKGMIAQSKEQALQFAQELGYPVLIRPSYVLGGRAMRIVYSKSELEYALTDPLFSEKNDILVDQYLENALECDVDALGDGHSAIVAGLMEHIEEAGIHSGDSTAVIPSFSLPKTVESLLRRQTKQLAQALKVKGLINVQFAIKDDQVFILEANPRSSRTVPFVSKAINKPIIQYATRLALGASLEQLELVDDLDTECSVYAVKRPVFPFARFPGVDTLLSPEMRSTGEVMGRDPDFSVAFVKALVAGGMNVPSPRSDEPSGVVLLTVRDQDKPALLSIARQLIDLGFQLDATKGTHDYLRRHNIPSALVAKAQEPSPTCLDLIVDQRYALVFNTVFGEASTKQSYSIRRRSLEKKVPCITTVREMTLLLQAFAHRAHHRHTWKALALQDE